MITVFVFPEFFEPEESLIPGRLKKAPKPEESHCPVDAFAATMRAPADFEFLLKVLKKNTELRVALFKAIRDEGFVSTRG